MNNPKHIGHKAEDYVKCYCEAQGYYPLAQNIKIFGIECDLIFELPNREIWILEVKTLKNMSYFERRVTPQQKKRLQSVLNSLLQKYPKRTIRAHLVTLDSLNNLRWHYDFFVI